MEDNSCNNVHLPFLLVRLKRESGSSIYAWSVRDKGIFSQGRTA